LYISYGDPVSAKLSAAMTQRDGALSKLGALRPFPLLYRAPWAQM